MSFKTPKYVAPAEDPLVTAQRKQAESDRITEIQKQVTSDTDALARLYGTQSVMSGGSMRAPILGY